MASVEESSGSRPDHHEVTEGSSGAAFQEAQKWIEAVTGKTFVEKDFRSSLENGILLCELLSSITPGLVKKINRLPTPIAGLDNLTMFLRGCEELGLKGSQLFDPGDLQDMSIRANLTDSDCSRKLKNVLITIYWLGKTANGCTSYSGPTLNLKEFEGLLSVMKKECVNEEPESPKRSVRDSGCVDNWESELSDSLSPPRHRREDSFDSLDSFSMQSQPTPSPDTVLRASSDDLDGDQRKLPDVLKDDMSARRVSFKEPRVAMPFNQYLPNKSNQSTFVSAQLRKRRSDREEERRSCSTSTSPIREEDVGISSETPLVLSSHRTVSWAVVEGAEPQLDEAELKKMKKLEKAGIRVLPASARYTSGGSSTPTSPPKSPQSSIFDPKHHLTLAERETLELRLAEKVRDEKEYEEQEEEEEKEQQPDLQKDDMMARRTGVFQKTSGRAYNRFLPLPGVKKETRPDESVQKESWTVFSDAHLDRNIKTKRFKVGQRVEQVEPEPKVPSSAVQKVPEVLDSSSTHVEVYRDGYNYPDNDDLDKDDMLARRTASYQKPSGNQFNAFLPKPGGVKVKKSVSGQYKSNLKSSGQETKKTSESSTPRSVTQPPADVDDMSRKCPQIMDGQKAGTVGMMGREIDVVGGAQAKSHLPLPDPDARHTYGLDDDVSLLIFSHKTPSVSDETESVSLIDMRDEEDDVDSQTRHERLHNQYNKVKEEEDQWQDDLARWKNRRRSASQDLIKKEEERKMMEKLMTSEGGSHRRKSIKTYKEIVEEKERREQELHELYCQASTPEEKAAILQRYALRFTISDAILEKLQLPKLPSVATHQSIHAYTLNEEVEISESQTFTKIETDSSGQYLKQTTDAILHTPDLSLIKDSKGSDIQLYPEIPLSPVRDNKTPEVQLSSAQESKTSEIQLSPVRESKTPEVQLSPVRESKTPEVQLFPVQESKTQVQLCPVQKSKAQEDQLSPVLESKTLDVQLSPVQESKTLEVQLFPVQESKTLEVQLSSAQEFKTPDICLSPSIDPKSLEVPLSPFRTNKISDVPLSPFRIPPAPSRPVPLLTPKPYSQPKFNQPSYKQVKNDGLVRVNGDSIIEDTRESPVRPVSFTPISSKPARQSPQQVLEISAGRETTAQECTQTSPIQKTEHIKDENDSHSCPVKKSIEDDTSKILTDPELTGKQTAMDAAVKRNCVVTTTIVTELRETHSLPAIDASIADQMSCSDEFSQKSDEISFTESRKADITSYSEGFDFTSECIETPILNLAKRVNHWTWDPNEERKRQERWQQEQERLLQEKYQQEQERLKQEWEKAQKEVEEEERKHNEEERRILEETVTPLTPHSSSGVKESSPISKTPRDTIVLSLADWERKQEMLEREAKMNQRNGLEHRSDETEAVSPPQQITQAADLQEIQSATPQLQFIQDGSSSRKSESRQEWKKTASLDRNVSPSQSQPPRMRRSGSYEHILGIHTSPSSQDTSPSSSDRSVSAKKLCSSCAQPLGKGAAMIIDTLGLYFHIQCFKCGVCKGLLGDSSTGTDVRIRNGVLNCHSCYMKSRAAGQPTTL
ncbi:LIM and calponin homology domains-containing protein 1a isoform X3 [Silurus meridionalis]|uniref:LIM and calponin homology domains-containing protein 1a isoform X3 n=1 Tax=Silurus meridionalis TaxID=175797 RepID=UPI001EEAD9E2|nr:LIM and calponin homology domains-containing protein 1a isoform X3 [Silurus meridionalis]